MTKIADELEMLTFKDGYRALARSHDKANHIILGPGETLTFYNKIFFRPPIIKYRDMKATYSWWKKRWGQ